MPISSASIAQANARASAQVISNASRSGGSTQTTPTPTSQTDPRRAVVTGATGGVPVAQLRSGGGGAYTQAQTPNQETKIVGPFSYGISSKNVNPASEVKALTPAEEMARAVNVNPSGKYPLSAEEHLNNYTPSRWENFKAYGQSALAGATGTSLVPMWGASSMSSKEYYSEYGSNIQKFQSPTGIFLNVGLKSLGLHNVLPTYDSAVLVKSGYATSFKSIRETQSLEYRKDIQSKEIERFNTRYSTFSSNQKVSEEQYRIWNYDVKALESYGVTKTNTTSSGFQLSSKELTTDTRPIYWKTMDTLSGGSKVAYTIAGLGLEVGQAVTIGYGLSSVGFVGGFSRGLSYLGSTMPKTSFVIKTFLVGSAVADVGYKYYEGYIYSGKKVSGGIIGATSGILNIGGFLAGASKGEMSPIKYEAVLTRGEGTDKTIVARTLGITNPFGKGSAPIFTKNLETGKLGWGYGKNMQFDYSLVGERGFQAGTNLQYGFYKTTIYPKLSTELQSISRSVEYVTSKSWNTKITDRQVMDLQNSKVYNSLGPQQQKNFQKFTYDLNKGAYSEKGGFSFKGFGKAILGIGPERYYGSGTFAQDINKVLPKDSTRMSGDIDTNMHRGGIKTSEKLYKVLNVKGETPVKYESGTGLIQIKTKTGWSNAFDIHGPDILDTQSAEGVFNLGTKNPKVGFINNQGVSFQQVPESLGQKGLGALNLVKTAEGTLTFQPKIGQEKAIVDFYNLGKYNSQFIQNPKTASRVLTELENYKALQSKRYVGLDWAYKPVDTNPIGVFNTLSVSNVIGSRTLTTSKTFTSRSSPSPRSSTSLIPSISASRSFTGSSSPSPSWKSPSLSTSISISPSPSPSFPSPSISISPSPSPSPSPSMSPSISPSFSPSPIIIPPFPASSMGAGFNWGLGKVGTRKITGYTPSFTALAFGLRGKKRKPTFRGKYTGLELRKIPKGWSIFKAMKRSK